MKNKDSELEKKNSNVVKSPANNTKSKKRKKNNNSTYFLKKSNKYFSHNPLRIKTYDANNYSDLKTDIVFFIANFISEDKVFEKTLISKTIVKKLKILKYLKLMFKTQNYHYNLAVKKKINTKVFEPHYYLDETPSELIVKFPGASSHGDQKMIIENVYDKISSNVLLDFFDIGGKILFEENLLETILKYNYKKVTFVGYSLGALLSSHILLILTLLNKKNHKIKNIEFALYVFNCPISLPNFLQKFINPYVVAVVNERDPVVCFRGTGDSNLYTVGGNNIFNFVKDKETGKVDCIKRSNNYFADNSFFYGISRIQEHDLRNLLNSVSLFVQS